MGMHVEEIHSIHEVCYYLRFRHPLRAWNIRMASVHFCHR